MDASVLRQWLWCISLLGMVIIAGCASTPTSQKSCPVTKKEVAYVQRQAEAGDADARFQLADWYHRGRCFPTDHLKEAKWIQRAAEQGHREAQFRLGQMLFFGTGVEKNESAATTWFRKAAQSKSF